MATPTDTKRLTELIDAHLSPKVEDPSWEIGVSNISGRGVIAIKDLKRGDEIYRENPLLIGPAALQEDLLNMCSLCFKILDETKFMCRKGCALPVCNTCGKKKKHRDECELFRSWEPVEPNVANSMVIRLLTVARSLLLSPEQQDLIVCLQTKIDNNHRSEVRLVAKSFRKFPTDKKIIDILNRAVAAVRSSGFDAAKAEKTTDHKEFPHRALFPLFGILNHDCVPNISYTFEEGTNVMIVNAAVDIAKGTELTTTYTKLFLTNIARHKFLKTKKLFVCKCKRCCDPTENGSFISALYCRNASCTGLVVPETTGYPQPIWICLKCKSKSNHSQMIKSQDLALGAFTAKLNADKIKVAIDYVNEKCSNFIPSSNHIVIDVKFQIIERLSQLKGQCTPEEYQNKARYCNDILEILDKLGVGNCTMRGYLETERDT